MSVEDAWLFPVVRAHTHPILIVQERSPFDSRQFGSFALYGLYMIIKYYGSGWINFVLKWYFVATGVGSVWVVSVISNRSFGAQAHALYIHGEILDAQVIGSLRGWQDPLAVV